MSPIALLFPQSVQLAKQATGNTERFAADWGYPAVNHSRLTSLRNQLSATWPTNRALITDFRS
jgi:hypothetical protein